MFRTIQDFLESWAFETEATLQLFEKLTDASLDQRVTAEGRSLGRIAWHIVQTLPEMGGRTGLTIAGPVETDPVPTNAMEIAGAFQEAAASLGEAVRSSWFDEDLETEDDMYGQMWTRTKTLTALVNHQNHHRGQMTVLMRQAGLVVPGVYGPAKEEWGAYGLPVQE
jgi:uncharacterized damage-inducible protein DinB